MINPYHFPQNNAVYLVIGNCLFCLLSTMKCCATGSCEIPGRQRNGHVVKHPATFFITRY